MPVCPHGTSGITFAQEDSELPDIKKAKCCLCETLKGVTSEEKNRWPRLVFGSCLSWESTDLARGVIACGKTPAATKYKKSFFTVFLSGFMNRRGTWTLGGNLVGGRGWRGKLGLCVAGGGRGFWMRRTVKGKEWIRSSWSCKEKFDGVREVSYFHLSTRCSGCGKGYRRGNQRSLVNP